MKKLIIIMLSMITLLGMGGCQSSDEIRIANAAGAGTTSEKVEAEIVKRIQINGKSAMCVILSIDDRTHFGQVWAKEPNGDLHMLYEYSTSDVIDNFCPHVSLY